MNQCNRFINTQIVNGCKWATHDTTISVMVKTIEEAVSHQYDP